MTSWYMVVGETSGTQANSARGVAATRSPASRWGALQRGSSDRGTAVELPSQPRSSRRWQSHSHRFWCRLKSLQWFNMNHVIKITRFLYNMLLIT